MALPESAKAIIRSGALGHLVTRGRNGAPHITCVWVAVDGDDLLTAHLNPHQRKLENVRNDPRVALSFEGNEIRPPGLREYVVVHGRAAREAGASGWRGAGRPGCCRRWRLSPGAPTQGPRRWTIRRPACVSASRSSV